MELAERNILSILSVILPVLSLLVPLFFLKHANYPQIGMYQWLVLIAIIIVPFALSHGKCLRLGRSRARGLSRRWALPDIGSSRVQRRASQRAMEERVRAASQSSAQAQGVSDDES